MCAELSPEYVSNFANTRSQERVYFPQSFRVLPCRQTATKNKFREQIRCHTEYVGTRVFAPSQRFNETNFNAVGCAGVSDA